MIIQYLASFLDSREEERITYTIQVQDLADISSVNSSVTTSFRLPKTLNNLNSLEYLSMVGDSSNAPYLKNECNLYDNGVMLINKGWLKINSSNKEEYNVNIESGIIDFYKTIENKKIGTDLDFSELNHNKDLVSVIDSFDRNDYCYIIADYNGLNTFKINNIEYINTDYLIPSLNNKYIWDKVFNYAGYTYDGSVFDTEDFKNLWITYPKAPPTDPEDSEFNEPILRLSTNNSGNLSLISYSTVGFLSNFTFKLENITASEVIVDSNNVIEIQQDGSYNLKGYVNGGAVYRFKNSAGQYVNRTYYFELRIVVNGVAQPYQSSEDYTLNLRKGDKVILLASHGVVSAQTGRSTLIERYFNGYDIKLYQTSQVLIDFGKEFLDVSITDYVKEIMIRFSLTPFIDAEKKHISFLTLNERLINSKLVDWTDKYLNRTNESYTYSSYAMNNFFKHKYNDPQADFNDGELVVANLNLEDEKTLFTSKFYSCNYEVTRFYSDDFINNSFPLWDREIEEVVNGNNRTFNVKYNGLNNRFYFIRREEVFKSFRLGSEVLGVQSTVNKVVKANTQNIGFNEIITSKYNNFSKILTNTRIHEIDLMLDINDLLNLDLEALYYFGQENQYYILNRLTIDLGNKASKGEFVRVQYR